MGLRTDKKMGQVGAGCSTRQKGALYIYALGGNELIKHISKIVNFLGNYESRMPTKDNIDKKK